GEERMRDRELQPLARERRAVGDEHVTAARLRLAKQLTRRGHSRLGRGLRTADAGELAAGLHAAPRLELLAIHDELDAGLAKQIGEQHRKAPRDDRALDADPAHGTEHELVAHLVERLRVPAQLVDAELLERMDHVPAALLEPRSLEHADDHVTGAVSLDVEE